MWPWGPDDPFRDIILEQRALEERLSITETKETPIYESGTYSPSYLGETIAGSTTYAANGRIGYWRRYGDLMNVMGRVEWTAATGTGNAIVSIPFTSANLTNLNPPGSLDTSAVTFANGTPVMLIPPNSLFFRMRSPLTNAAPTNVAVEAAGIINFSVWYIRT